MANLAKFTINATPSSPPGFDGSISQVLTLALEAPLSSLVYLWTVEVFDANDASSPTASKNAPTLTLVGATSGQKVNASTPSSTVTVQLPGSGVHSWKIRSRVNGSTHPDHVYERIVCIKTGSGLRKVLYDERAEYSARGQADAQNDLIDAGAGPLTAPGGAGDANKLAAANGAGANLQYSPVWRLTESGTNLRLDAVEDDAGMYHQSSADATDTTRRNIFLRGQSVSGNGTTIGGTVDIAAGNATGSGGTHDGGNLLLSGGWATGASGTRRGGHAKLAGGAGTTSYGNIYLGTDFSHSQNWQSMQRGILVQNAIAAPTGDMSDGHAYWSDGGRPMWRFLGTRLRLDGTAAGASAGAGAAPPATVQGYLTVQIDGTARKIPYYAN